MKAPKNWSPELEGLRGLASLWVLLGHICILINYSFPLLSDPSMGVDLFILLSGFLMAKNYQERREVEPWTDPATFKKFWLRRYFRIAPLYYVLLVVAIGFGPYFGEMRDVISSFYPSTATEVSRYADQSFGNLATHVLFLFGFLPHYAFNTVLPDWSIGLEMQYYALFPFIMLAIMRFGYPATCVVLMLAGIALKFALPAYVDAFKMPSLIFLKLHMFVAGMLIAEAVRRMQVRYLLLALLAPVISIFLTIGWHKVRIGMEALMILLMAAILWKFRAGSMMATVMSLPKRLLTLRFSTFLGDVSYSVYMLHLLIVIPVCGLLLSHTALAQQGAVLRFLEVAALCLPVTYLLAMLLYKGVEKPGIKLGKYVLRQNKAEPRIEPLA